MAYSPVYSLRQIPRTTGVAQGVRKSKFGTNRWLTVNSLVDVLPFAIRTKNPGESTRLAKNGLFFDRNQRYVCCHEEQPEKRSAIPATGSKACSFTMHHRPDRKGTVCHPLGNRGPTITGSPNRMAQETSRGNLIAKQPNWYGITSVAVGGSPRLPRTR
jgi:hypothetical protein